VHFVRHGESEANRLRVLSNRDQPHPLTALGRQQARETAPALTGIRAIYSSPIRRARETAAIIAERLGVAVVIDDALREFDCGVMEGRGDEAAWGEWRRVWRSWAAGDHGARVEGGECYQDVRDRFIPFVREVVRLHEGEDIVLVGHGALFMTQLANVLENVSANFALANPVAHVLPVTASTLPDGRLVCEWWCGLPSPFL
jgi:broad specificity phosphatase PhoE